MAGSTSFWGLLSDAVISASWLEQLVLLVLVSMSVVSWAIIIQKLNALRKLQANNAAFREVFDVAEHTGQVSEGFKPETGPAPLFAVFSAAIQAREQARLDAVTSVSVPVGEMTLRSPHQLDERVRLAMDHAQKAEFTQIGKHLSVLATAGSTSPFIGLFGTVWGILATFQTLGGAKSASLQALGPPIAAALIATAAGLAVAIPAVMFYNWITTRIDEDTEDVRGFTEIMLRLMRASGAVAEPSAPTQPAAAAGASAAPSRDPARVESRTIARSA